MSPQLIDLPLKKDWYVSLQITRQDDLKLAVERFKVWHCVAMHCIGRSIPVSCHCFFQRRALNLVARGTSSQSKLRDLLLPFRIEASEFVLRRRHLETWELSLFVCFENEKARRLGE